MTTSEQNTLKQLMVANHVMFVPDAINSVRAWLEQFKLPDNHPIVTATINMLLLRLEK